MSVLHPPYVRVRRLHISFPTHLDAERSLRTSLARALRFAPQPKRRSYKAALSNISFTLRAGDRLALIGANGSGKTTLLRALNGVYEPVQGKIVIRGTTAALINATLGMDPFRNGNDNIFLRGLQMGLSREDMASRVEDIVDFAELGEDITRPVRTYSSGMMARLAFGIMTSVKADIYLMDEWIGAGDKRFFDRAQERISGLFQDRSILVLASHSDALVKRWCNKALVLHKGHQYFLGDIDAGLEIKNRLMKNEFVRVPLRSFRP